MVHKFCKNPKKFKKAKNHQIKEKKEKNIVTSHANISQAPFDQRSPRLPEEGVLNGHRQTETQPDTQTDMATL